MLRKTPPLFAFSFCLCAACQKPYEPGPLPTENPLLSAVIIYTENQQNDTIRQFLRYDNQQRFTGFQQYPAGSGEPYFDLNETGYNANWMISQLATSDADYTYRQSDSVQLNAGFNPVIRRYQGRFESKGSGTRSATDGAVYAYTYDNQGYYQQFFKKGWANLFKTDMGTALWITNADSSTGVLKVLQDNLSEIIVEGWSSSKDSTATQVIKTESSGTHIKKFLYPNNTPSPTANPNHYAQAVFYPLEPFFFNGSRSFKNLPDIMLQEIEDRDGNGQVTGRFTSEIRYAYTFYPFGNIETIRLSYSGGTIVYRYIYDIN